jgi:cytochrome P450
MRSTRPAAERPQPPAAGLDLFSLLYDNMLSADGDNHRRLRGLVSRAFTRRNVESMAPRIQEIAGELIDDFAPSGQVDLIEAYAFPLPIIVICELLGIPPRDRLQFRRWSHAFIGIDYDENTHFGQLVEFVRYITGLIDDRRAQPRDDLISALVQAEEDGQSLTQQELTSMIALLIVAGHETTVNLIGNGTAALLQHPDQTAVLRRDPALIAGAIDEFLRYAGPVEFATQRFAAEDVLISGTLIRRGTPVTVILAAANRDPQPFARPDALRVLRDAHQHLGFGYGVHYCIGAPLARLEAKIAFNTLLERLPTLQLAIPAADLVYTEGAVVRGLVRLPVKWKPSS